MEHLSQKKDFGIQLSDTASRVAWSGMFLALALVLPALFGHIQQIGIMLSPMHIPVLLCGFLVGKYHGAVVGILAPISRHLIAGMPPLPVAVPMMFELGLYGFLAGLLFVVLNKTKLAKINKGLCIYAALAVSMVAGRVLWGLVSWLLFSVGFSVMPIFNMSVFANNILVMGWPGIILHLSIIPPILAALQRALKVGSI